MHLPRQNLLFSIFVKAFLSILKEGFQDMNFDPVHQCYFPFLKCDTCVIVTRGAAELKSMSDQCSRLPLEAKRPSHLLLKKGPRRDFVACIYVLCVQEEWKWMSRLDFTWSFCSSDPELADPPAAAFATTPVPRLPDHWMFLLPFS